MSADQPSHRSAGLPRHAPPRRPSAAAAVSTSWFAADELSRKARVVTIRGIYAVDAPAFDDPYVAISALAYLSNLEETSDTRLARIRTFHDVRDLLDAEALTSKDTEVLAATVEVLRADLRKQRALRQMAAAIGRPNANTERTTATTAASPASGTDTAHRPTQEEETP